METSQEVNEEKKQEVENVGNKDGEIRCECCQRLKSLVKGKWVRNKLTGGMLCWLCYMRAKMRERRKKLWLAKKELKRESN